MKTVCEKDKCNGCMACVDKCPKKSIEIEDNLDTFNAFIDESKCIRCKLCKEICPNINKVEKIKPISWYQGWGEKSVRKRGASGGIASTVIYHFIKSGGYVASCIYDKGEFKFDITNNIEKAKRFAGSKYVKSNPKGIYNKIENIIKDNKVLFIGLPCQVAVIKNIIKNKENLYTVDLICHGTPSPKILNKFLKENKIDESLISDIKFRNKTDFGLIINNNKLRKKRVLDEYTSAFLEAINYTENCYDCEYASIERVSDITLGDSWGSELRNEEKNGISLILVQTKKGEELIKNENIILKDVNINKAIKYNHQLEKPSSLSKKRTKYFKLIKKGKSFKYSTFVVLPKKMMKQYIKDVLVKFKIFN